MNESVLLFDNKPLVSRLLADLLRSITEKRRLKTQKSIDFQPFMARQLSPNANVKALRDGLLLVVRM